MINVAVAVIQASDGRVLLTQRRTGQDFAGDWEFPGGKQEPDETIEQALSREVHEEIGLLVTQYAPMMVIPWHYSHKAVRLHVWRVTSWQGHPYPQQGQNMRWFTLDELRLLSMPPANQGIVSALSLPARYAITGKFDDHAALLRGVEHALSLGAGIIQLRAKLQMDAYVALALAIAPVIAEAGAQLLLNASVDVWRRVPNAGMHLTSEQLWSLCERPVPKSVWLSASVHNQEQLQQAQLLGVDMLLLSPVLPTASHPHEPALGWEKAAAMAAEATVPVYALGGVGVAEQSVAQSHGFQGVAGIGAFWSTGGNP